VQRYPAAAAGVLPGYHVVSKAADALVFTRNSPFPQSTSPAALAIPVAWHVAYLLLCALFAFATVAGMRHTSRELTGKKALQQ
jgi:hypothetical protein